MANITLATTSNWTFTSAMGIYMLAATFCAGEYVLERSRVRAAAIAPQPVPVGVGGGSGAGLVPSELSAAPGGDRNDGLSRRSGQLGIALTVVGALVHLTSVVLRGLAADRVPWGNMYEYLSAVCLAAVLAFLVLLLRQPARRVAVFVLLPVAVLMFIAGNSLYIEAGSLTPSLHSYWITIHVTAALLASGVFLLSGITSALHLVATARSTRGEAGVAERHARGDAARVVKRKAAPSRLPEPEFLDKLAYRTGTFGFLALTFAIMTGAIWAEQAWGRYWGWDPKETYAFVSWVFYAAYLHARSTPGFRSRRAAWVNVAGLALVFFNLFFINLVVVGLHSYAGVR